MTETSEAIVSYSLGKNYKLCSRKTIDEVFKAGVSIKAYPFIALIYPTQFSDGNSLKFVFSAPKKKFKKAVQRNRVKRICKEAVRLNKSSLEEYLVNNKQQLAVVLIYTSNDELKFEQLQRKTQKLFNAIIQHLNEANT
ncbi:MAG: ribonuclease P protein component [Crocinitomicaceae bacterium]|nr:ribonuclease P protein component [Crocinitomicaceae bacterium]